MRERLVPAGFVEPRRLAPAGAASLALHGVFAGAILLAAWRSVPLPAGGGPQAMEVMWAPAAGETNAETEEAETEEATADPAVPDPVPAPPAPVAEAMPLPPPSVVIPPPPVAAAMPEPVAQPVAVAPPPLPPMPQAEAVPAAVIPPPPDETAMAAEIPPPPPAPAVEPPRMLALAPPLPVTPPPEPPPAPSQAAAEPPPVNQPPVTPPPEPRPQQVATRTPPPQPAARPAPRRTESAQRPAGPRRTADGGLPGEGTPGIAAPMPAGPIHMTNPRYRRPPTPPVYPTRARELGITGTVLVRALISPDGDTRDCRVQRSSGHPQLDGAAVDAVRRWAFEPASHAGRRVEAWVEIPIHFRIN